MRGHYVRCSVFGIDRTPNTLQTCPMLIHAPSADALLLEALTELGFPASLGAEWDLVIPLEPAPVRLSTIRVALADRPYVERLLEEHSGSRATLVVVADRVTSAARNLLAEHSAGYLDLRGHLRIRTPQILIETSVAARREGPTRSAGIQGKTALEVAVQILLQPDVRPAVRAMARSLSRAPSSVSAALASLREASLIDGKNRLLGDALFWEVAAQWSYPRFLLASAPDPGDPLFTRFLDSDDPSISNWVLTGNIAAAEYGAPIGVRGNQPPDFFVPDETVMRKAMRLLGSSEPGHERAYVRTAPMSAVITRQVAVGPRDSWPLTHPLFVALDLAQDEGRGRLVLSDWTPEGPWQRVW